MQSEDKREANTQMICVRNLSKQYGSTLVFEQLNFEIYEGEILVIMGESGVGKSTLLNLLGKIESDFKGEIVYGHGLTDSFPFVFQAFESLLPWLTVEQNISWLNPKSTSREINRWLELLKLTERKKYYPSELSGGQKQRVALARAFVGKPKMVFLDEPFASLDRELREELQEMLVQINREEAVTMVIVTHDIQEARKLGTRTLLLKETGIDEL